MSCGASADEDISPSTCGPSTFTLPSLAGPSTSHSVCEVSGGLLCSATILACMGIGLNHITHKPSERNTVGC